jgi:hypothetical protein
MQHHSCIKQQISKPQLDSIWNKYSTSTTNQQMCLPSMMSPCEMCKLPGSPEELFSRQTTCIPGRIRDLGVSVGVVALPAEPDWDEVPTPELKDKTSTWESATKETRRVQFGESKLNSSAKKGDNLKWERETWTRRNSERQRERKRGKWVKNEQLKNI